MTAPKVRLVATAHCLAPGCEWTAEGPTADREAVRHTERDPRHPTVSSSRPEAK